MTPESIYRSPSEHVFELAFCKQADSEINEESKICKQYIIRKNVIEK